MEARSATGTATSQIGTENRRGADQSTFNRICRCGCILCLCATDSMAYGDWKGREVLPPPKMSRFPASWRIGQRAGATAAASRAAGQAVRRRRYGALNQHLRCDVPKKEWLPVPKLHRQHLVEVAVIDLAQVVDAQCRAAHKIIDGRGIEILHQEMQVFLPFILTSKVFGKPRDRLIGNSVEMVEHNPVVTPEGLLVVSLQFSLRAR